MGLTKTEHYTEEQLYLAKCMKVLGHPARVAIFQSILNSQACICGDLVTEIGLAQATISQHLRELKAIGLIKGTIDGTSVCYCVDQVNWDKVQSAFLSIDAKKGSSQDKCC